MGVPSSRANLLERPRRNKSAKVVESSRSTRDRGSLSAWLGVHAPSHWPNVFDLRSYGAPYLAACIPT